MTDAYDVTLDRTPRRVVVKLYRDGDGTAPLEWSRLEFAQRVAALPVPEPMVAESGVRLVRQAHRGHVRGCLGVRT